jgi:hypothetical protein
MTTDFSNKVQILGEFYFTYKEDKELKEFIEFNDLGLPLAYLASENLCAISEEGIGYINETWNILMGSLGIEDIGFEDIETMMEYAEKNGLDEA